MSSAEDVQNTNGILALPRFQKCMGRVPSDEKIPDDMSEEDKCTVLGTAPVSQSSRPQVDDAIPTREDVYA